MNEHSQENVSEINLRLLSRKACGWLDVYLLINEEETVIIRLFYEQFIASESCTEIAYMLNKHFYRTKTKKMSDGRITEGQYFQPKSIRRILQNPYYKKYVTHKGNAYPGEHEAIIDEEMWNNVQEILAQHFANCKPKSLASTSSFLKEILKFGFCDSLMKPTVTIKHSLRYR